MTTAQINNNNISIPANTPFTDTLANLVLAEHKNSLPDLSQVQIFLPNAQAVMQMRSSLVKQSAHALIGGFIGNLGQWLVENIAPPAHITKHISQATRQLLLIEALKQHPDLFSVDNHWQICDSLLELFDELSLSQHHWLNESAPVWTKHLQQAYKTDKEFVHLNQEARIIQTLWQAWQQQLADMKIDDDSSAHKHRLQEKIPEAYKNTCFYIVGFEQFTPLEQAWCKQLSTLANVKWVTQGNIPGQETTEESQHKDLKLLNDIFSQKEHFHSRSLQYKNKENSCFINRIKLYDAQSAEQESQAVDLKVRMSLLDGKNNIAVVTENRKLARRLRALLERAGINIQDTAGWALATTSAATVLERWLECIEQDFAYQPLLDLLKSPFFCNQENHNDHLNLVYRFEQDVVLHENIANDLQRYKAAIKHRKERLDLNISSTEKQLTELLNKIGNASTELVALYKSDKSATPDIWIKYFINSIEQLGVFKQLSKDIAGLRVQQELEKLTQAYSSAQPDMNWDDFRTWLGSTLEREQFKPHNQSSAVKIMNMQQAQYCQFDTLIIAGANMQSLPGSVSQLPFFNQSVRQALQLKNWHQQKEYQLYQFQQLLFSADDILITWQAEQNGEWLQPSPWVISIQNFCQHAFNYDTRDDQLELRLNTIKPVTNRLDELVNNIPTVSQAFPAIESAQVPTEISASRHQRLLDCPYKFFAADTLKLKPLERISQELMKSEYGENVHLILHAFHQQCPDLPAPFESVITEQNKTQALQHLEKLSKQVFEQHVEDSIQHRGWLERWMLTAETYIDWQIQRQKDWQIANLELQAEHQLSPEIKLIGRLDRVDKQGNQYSIVDYKTGGTAKQQDIDLAENIQLTSYAALMDEVCDVIYLKLDKGETRQTGILQGDALEELTTDVSTRLETIISQIKASTPLPAWGDTHTCSYCDMHGLCRKQMWEVNLALK